VENLGRSFFSLQRPSVTLRAGSSPSPLHGAHPCLSLSLSLSLCVCVCVSLCLSLYRLQSLLRYIPFFKRTSPACMLARAGACLGNHLMANLMRT
jgi:hypothetical protein